MKRAAGQFVKPPHKAAARSIAETLWLLQGGAEPGPMCAALAVKLRRDLTDQERARLAWAALVACGEDVARQVVAEAFPPEE